MSPGHHVLHNILLDDLVFAQQLQHTPSKQLCDLGHIVNGTTLKYNTARIGIIDRPVCDQGVQMTVKIQLVTRGLNQNDHARGRKRPLLPITHCQKNGLFGRLNQEGQQLVAVSKITPQPLGDRKRPEPVRHILMNNVVHDIIEPEFQLLLMTAWAKQACLA